MVPRRSFYVTEEAFRELEDQGLLVRINGEWQLTEEGERVTHSASRRRRLAERLLVEAKFPAANVAKKRGRHTSA